MKSLNSIADPSGIKEFDPNEKILDVASALTTDNQSKTVQIMEKYNATYIMIGKNDLVNSVWMFKIAGLNYTDYLANQGEYLGFTDLGKNTMIARLLDNRDTGAFTLVYQRPRNENLQISVSVEGTITLKSKVAAKPKKPKVQSVISSRFRSTYPLPCSSLARLVLLAVALFHSTLWAGQEYLSS